jgi:protein HOOK3
VAELTRTVDELRGTAAEVVKLRDQVDEYRQVEDRLHKSENVIEKYKKKLEDNSGLRRELRQLEEENAVMIDKNSELEIELRKLGASKALVDNYRGQVEQLEKKVERQHREMAQITVQLEEAQAALVEMETDRDRLRDEVHIHTERIKEFEQGPTARRQVSAIEDADASLDIELDASGDEGDGASRRE